MIYPLKRSIVPGITFGRINFWFCYEQHPLPACLWQFALRERLKLPELTCDPVLANPIDSYDHPPLTQHQIKCKQIKESLELDLVASIIWKVGRIF